MAGNPPPGGPYQGYPQQPQQPPAGYPQQGYGQPQPNYGQPQPPNPQAPYGVHPRTGLPYSDKQKSIVGILQFIWVVVGFGGIGRLYAGHIGIGVAQLILSCTGIGQIWSAIDGLIILTSDEAVDGNGLPLRPN